MSEYISTVLKIIWLVVVLYWIIAGWSVKKSGQQERPFHRLLYYWLPLIIAVLLLGPGSWYGHSWLRENFIAHSDRVGLVGLSLSISGAVIACWSRFLLGRNWSLSVQRKEHHELIQTGLYKKIRHPVYTGLLLLFTGNALIVGDYRAIVAVAVVCASFWFKIRKEEQLMTTIFGEQYTAYKKRTKALIPFLL